MLKFIYTSFLLVFFAVLTSFAQPIILVKDINPGTSVTNMLTKDSLLYFTADDGASGAELWISDGTDAGSSIVKDINPSGSSEPQYFIEFNGIVYFKATDGTNGYELWRTDGTSAGTYMVKDINPTGNSIITPIVFYPTTHNPFIVMNNALYFFATNGINDYELWKSDGTSAGTVMVKDINPTGPSFNNSANNSRYFVELNNNLFFVATDGVNGFELWKSDGSAIGTVMFQDLIPGSGSSFPDYLTKMNDAIYYQVDDGVSGIELWKTDGTLAGTTMVKDIWPGVAGSKPEEIIVFNNTLFFSASTPGTGGELWKSDGTSSGTSLVKDICPSCNSYPYNFATTKNAVYFCGYDGTGVYYLWRSDGTANGTVLVKNVENPQPRFSIDTLYYFSGYTTALGNELWKTDGTTTGTALVEDLYPGSTASYPGYGSRICGDYYFFAGDNIHGGALWSLKISECPPVVTGVENATPELACNVSIFPNPMLKGHSISIKSTSEVNKVIVTNALGERNEFLKTNEFIYDKPGLICVQVFTNNQSYSFKVIVE